MKYSRSGLSYTIVVFVFVLRLQESPILILFAKMFSSSLE